MPTCSSASFYHALGQGRAVSAGGDVGTLDAYLAQQVADGVGGVGLAAFGRPEACPVLLVVAPAAGWLAPAGLARQPGPRTGNDPRWWQHAERGRQVKGDAHDPG